MKRKDASRLTPEEREIEESLERGEYRRVPRKEWGSYRDAARETLKLMKDERINIRLPRRDLDRLKRIAYREGLPYQTMISSVLHRFSTGRLVQK